MDKRDGLRRVTRMRAHAAGQATCAEDRHDGLQVEWKRLALQA